MAAARKPIGSGRLACAKKSSKRAGEVYSVTPYGVMGESGIVPIG